VPVLVCGNGIGLLGNADATCTAPAAAAPGSGPDGGVVDVDAPVTVCGVAVGVLGDASVECTPPAGAPADGGGTVDVDAPVTVCGIGIGLLGDAKATCTGPSAPATSPGGPGADDGVVLGAFRSVVPAAAGAWSGGGRATGSAGSELAFTGATLTPVMLGLVALAMGLSLMMLGRPRGGGRG
jgi:hypothetical protein